MGITAENVAKKYDISREQQDALALASQSKAAAAQDAGYFKDEIVPVAIPQKKGDPIVFDADEFINRKSTRRGAGRPASRVRQGRLGDGRQRVGPQRRRRGRGGDDGRQGRRSWA